MISNNAGKTDENDTDQAIKAPYALTIDLNTLNHLGIGLYSNVPAVISEVVANAYDADASVVEISIDTAARKIIVSDDGWGMSNQDINDKYLKVGYRKRDKESAVTPRGRHVMGRKGIGKLALFSIADTIEVHSVKIHDGGRVEKSGFVMNARKIQNAIKSAEVTAYEPDPVPAEAITILKGTRIELRDMRSLDVTKPYLRRRLARRFSVVGEKYGFDVKIDNLALDLSERDYFDKIEYIWYIGDESEFYADACKNKLFAEKVDGTVDAPRGWYVEGWIGTFDEQKSIDEGNNTIVVMAWGKLIHEDLLKDLKESGVYAKYLIGRSVLTSLIWMERTTSPRATVKASRKTIRVSWHSKTLSSRRF